MKKNSKDVTGRLNNELKLTIKLRKDERSCCYRWFNTLKVHHLCDAKNTEGTAEFGNKKRNNYKMQIEDISKC